MEPKPNPSRSTKLICNISTTKYEVVRHICKKLLHWKLTTDEESDEWDVFWTDSAVQPEKLAKMHHYQRINHFPGMYLISRKNYLAFNLCKLRKLFPNEYNFFPKTWVVPCDLSELKTFMSGKKNPFVIVKPEASCQGRGIYITKKIEEISPDERHVVQEYLCKPYLIDNLKFDLRIYVLVTSCDPLRVFVHEDGLTRFATEEYEEPDSGNVEELCMHLTNYAINKNNPNFVYNEDPDCDDVGHKRSLKSTYEYLLEKKCDVEKLKARIDDMIIKTLCTVQPNLSHHYKACQSDDYSRSMCFEVLGFDVILDRKLNPYILEVNHTPSFTTDTPLDRVVKKKVISDTLSLINVSLNNRKKFFRKQKEDLFKRSLTGKLERPNKEQKEAIFELMARKKDKYEARHAGGYRKIYPVDGSDYYQQFIEAADNIWKEWTGAKIVRRKKIESPALKPIINRQINAKCKNGKRYQQVFSMEKSNCSMERSNFSNERSNLSIERSNFSIERPNSTIFERLSQPIMRKFRSNTAGTVVGVVYEEKKEERKEFPVYVYGEAEKLLVKTRNLSENRRSSPSRTVEKRQIEVLKQLLTSRQNTVAKNKYLEYLLNNR